MSNEQQFVYLVKENNYGEIEEFNHTISVFNNEEVAIECARILNKKHGMSCLFTKDGDFVEMYQDLPVEPTFYVVEKQEVLSTNTEKLSLKDVEDWNKRIENNEIEVE